MQERLHFEDFNDALREVVKSLGGAKRVGPQLWPEKTVEQAQQQLLACLNTERKERLTPEQVFYLLKQSREAGFHSAKQWLDIELGYEPGRPMDPLDERARLERDFIEAVRASRQIAERLDRLMSSPLKAVG